MSGRLTIALEDVVVFARHGVFEQENYVGAEFRVDVSVDVPVPFVSADELEQTISYADVYEEVKGVMQTPCQLLETVCQRLADRLQERWPQITGGFVKVTKVSPPIAGMQGRASVRLTF